MRTLKEFLKKHKACEDVYLFAKDLTLEQFLKTCERGDWILWLFVKSNPKDKKLRTLVAGHCANTVRHLMKDERSIKAVDIAIKYGEGKATREQLDAAYDDAASSAASNYAYAATFAAGAALTLADLAATAAADANADLAYGNYTADADKNKNQKLTSDICREYLPIELWNIK